MILCAAGDIHGAMDRPYEDVLAFECWNWQHHRPAPRRGLRVMDELTGSGRLV